MRLEWDKNGLKSIDEVQCKGKLLSLSKQFIDQMQEEEGGETKLKSNLTGTAKFT